MRDIKYRSEDEMKDSGVKWLGVIPIGWKGTTLKYLYRYQKGKNPKAFISDNKSTPYVTADFLRTGETDNYISSTRGLVEVEEDDLLLLWDGANAGEFFYGKKGVLGSTFAKLEIITKDNKEYFKYYLKSYEAYLKKMTIGMGIPHVNSEVLKGLIFYKTDINEQRKIANFLDIQTGQLDSIISKKEKLIKKLEKAKKSLISEVVTGKVKIVDGEIVERKTEEMKDSGVECLGMMPREWDIKKVKHITTKTGSGKTPRGGSEVYVDEGILFLRSQNIHNVGLKLDDVVFIDFKTNKEMINSIVKKGDILLNITGASIGRCCLYDLEDKANVNQHVCIIRLKNWIAYNKYIEIVFQSNIIQDYISACQTGSSREGLNFEQIGEIIFPIPEDEKEVFKIMETVDIKIANLYSIITKTKLQIQKLTQAKQSLISEAVTGKIDLRDWEIIEEGEVQ